MAEPFQLEEGSLRTGASVGLVFGQAAPGLEPEVVLTQGDVALSHAKSQGGGRFCLYHPEMSAQAAVRRQLEGDLGEALARGEMFLHFQPLCTNTGAPRGFEAMLRWQHRERGLISPAEFIPYAERSGHIRAIGLFVLEEACRAAMGWPAHLRVAVNISAVQLSDDGLFDAIKTILARTGLPPQRLELEITESTLIEDAVRVGALLRAMHEYGLALAIDDFGTGYSNLSHLRDFCASRLKIDRSLISGLRSDCDAASIARAISSLGHALGMAVLAEGVETETELTLVRAMGCDEVQGYYLARPMPEADITAWLAKFRRSPVPALTA
jgi:EAL domain-containing protein (putative c-di-GMP-specific phosphodiesterase class I)